MLSLRILHTHIHIQTYLRVAGSYAGQTRGHGAGGGRVRAHRDHRGVTGVMRQQRGGMRVRGEMRMLRLRVMQLRAGRCTLHHHRDGRWPGVDRRPAATLAIGAAAEDRIAAATLASAKRLVQVLAHLVLLLLHHVITRRILQQRAHLQIFENLNLNILYCNYVVNNQIKNKI